MILKSFRLTQNQLRLLARSIPAALLLCLAGLVGTLATVPSRADTIEHSGTISAQTTWSADDVHLVTANLTVGIGVRLTIEAGTVVKLGTNVQLRIDGVLEAAGTLTDPIIFTSYRDDSVGGDTNGDGPSRGQPGDWSGLYFDDSVTDSQVIFDHVQVRYGGAGDRGQIRIDRADLDLTNCDVRDGSGDGLYINDNLTRIQGCVIEDNAGTGIYVRGNAGDEQARLIGNRISGNQDGVRVNAAIPVIADNEISDNADWGIDFEGTWAAPPITGNQITGNARAARLPASALPQPGDGNRLTPNDRSGLWIRGNELSRDLVLGIEGSGTEELSRYHIEGRLNVPAGRSLSIDPGVVIKFADGAGMDIVGALQALGTHQAPIVFTGERDDAHGADMNADGTASAPANGDWRGLSFANAEDGASELRHVKVLYGGSYVANVYSNNTDLTIADSELAHSGGDGLYGVTATLTFADLEIYGNAEHGLFLTSSTTSNLTGGRLYANFGDGIYLAGNAALSLSGSELFANLGAGLRNTGNQAIDASGNWWGAVDGPGGDAPGSGDQVHNTGAGNIDAGAFLTDGSRFGFFDAGANLGEGMLPAPTVTQGSDSAELGAGPVERMLYDLDAIILDYSGLPLPEVARFDLFAVYRNPDDTSGIGGNRQRLDDGSGAPVHDTLAVDDRIVQVRHPLAPSAHADSNLQLAVVRENGYRSVLQALWLVERGLDGDDQAPSSNITAPLADAQLRGERVQITGSSSDPGGRLEAVQIGIDAGAGPIWSPVGELAGDGSWRYSWQLPAQDGVYRIHARARDAAGNLEPVGAGLHVQINQTPPAAPTGLLAHDTPGDNGGSIELSWTPSADDGANAGDVSGYRIERRPVGDPDYGTVTSLSAGSSEYSDASAATGSAYDYRIIAIDTAGNETPSAPWLGVIAIDNAGDGTAPEDATGLIGIAGNEFVQLTWTPSADSTGDVVDQLLERSTDGGATWENPVVLAKHLATYLIEGLTNEQPYRFRLRTRDGADNLSAGVLSAELTPSPSAYTEVSGSIGVDSVWSAGVYHVAGNLSISGATLRIEPGVIVKVGAGRSINVTNGGALDAAGSAARPVIFTAWSDDDYGGDNNGDGPSNGTAGDWFRLSFSSSADAAGSRLSHVLVRYSGAAGHSVQLDRVDVPVLDSQIRDGNGHGLFISQAAPLVQGNRIEANSGNGIQTLFGAPRLLDNQILGNQNGIFLQYGSAEIAGNQIRDNSGYGIFNQDARDLPEIRANTITDNGIGVRLPFSALPGAAAGNLIGPNDQDHIEVIGNPLARSLALPAGQVYYQVSGSAKVAAGAALELAPGLIWKFGNGAGMDIDGALRAEGTQAEPIIFTSYRDDSAGGDTDGGGPSAGAPGDWDNLSFSDTVIDFLTRLTQVQVRYAGDNALYARGADIDIRDCTLRDNAGVGLYLYENSTRVEGCTIEDNAGYGVGLFATYYNPAWRPRLSDNHIRRNAGGIQSRLIGAEIDANHILDNTGWGIDYQRTHQAPIPSGNQITGNARAARLPASALPQPGDGNRLTPNHRSGLWIRGNELSRDLVLGIEGSGTEELSRYHIEGRLNVPAGRSLSIDPGVVIKFADGAGMDIVGALQALGTHQAPIVFTGERDDAHGADMNADGTASAPANGDWRGLSFANAEDGASELRHVKVLYGGSYVANVYSNNTDLTIADSELAHSGGDGLYGVTATLTFADLEIYGNAEHGLFLTSSTTSNLTGGRLYANFGDGIYLAGNAALSLSGSELFANLGAGLRNTGNQAIDANGNWWGAVDGPGGDAPGSGDQVHNTGAGNIDAGAFLTDGSRFGFFDAGANLGEGMLPAPTVTQGSDSAELGAGPVERMLYDLDAIILDYSGLPLPEVARFDLFAVYRNPDDTSGIGGNRQRLDDGSGAPVHDTLAVDDRIVQVRHPLAPSAHADSNLQLAVVRENGYRSVLQALWLVERGLDGDDQAPSSNITAPLADAQLRGERVQITGSSSDPGGRLEAVQIGIDAGAGPIWSPVGELAGDGSWRYSWQLPAQDGVYRIHARARDAAGNLEPVGAGLHVQINQTPPAAPTGLLAHDTPGDNGGSIELSWTPSADDGANAGDVSGYRIERRPVGDPDYGTVTSLSAGSSEYSDASAATGSAYDYRIIAIDTAGNETPSAPWLGVIAIDNAGDGTAPEDATGLIGIAGNEFVQLTWTPSADSTGDVVDQLLERSTDGGATWENPVVLAKHLATYLIEGLTNEQPYRFRLRTRDGADNLSAGVLSAELTPSPSAYTEVSGSIGVDSVWSAGVYHVAGNLSISGATLRIEPGVIVKVGAGRSINVTNGGALDAAGSAARPVIFTAWSDDDYGGDNNGDGPSNGTAGDWFRLSFSSSADAAGSRLSHVLVRYSGAAGHSVQLDRVDVPVLDSQIRDGNGHGLFISQAAPLVQGNRIEANSGNGIQTLFGAPRLLDNQILGNQNGIFLQYGSAEIAGNQIRDNSGYGIFNQDARDLPEIRANTITDNGIGVRLPFSALPGAAAGNLIGPNDQDHIEVIGNPLARSLALPAGQVYYQVSGSAKVAAGAALELAPGLIWKFGNGAGMDIDGALRAEGTQAEPIIFTSYRDDSAGGDTDGGGPSAGAPGDWDNLSFSDTVIDFLTRLTQVQVRYAGDNALYARGADIDIRDCTLRDNAGVGLYLYENSTRVEGCTIEDNAGYGVGLFATYYNPAWRPRLSDNHIRRNAGGIQSRLIGAEIDANHILDNTGWGIDYQRTHQAPIPSGNQITGNARAARLPASALPQPGDGNRLTPNHRSGLWIRGNELSRDLVLGIEGSGTEELSRYHIEGRLNVPAGRSLSIDPGVVIKFADGAGMDIVGALQALGTHQAPIVFTGERDDAHGADMNADGTASAPANGDWRGLSFANAEDGASELRHVKVLYGGSYVANVYSNNTDLTIADSELAHSGGDGLYGVTATLTFADLEIYGNAEHGLFLTSSTTSNLTGGRLYANFGDGIYLAGNAALSLSGSELFANLGAGLRNTGNQAIDASGNWWGAVDGPGGDAPGSGDQVHNTGAGNIDAGAFLTDGSEFLFFDAGGTEHAAYGIGLPNVTGNPSVEWGSGPAETFLYDFDADLTAELTGLAGGSGYRLLPIYLNQDAGGGSQSLRVANGEVIHAAFPLPTAAPVAYSFPLPVSSITDGTLGLIFSRAGGPRTLLGGLFLVKDANPDVTAPVLTLDSPLDGSIVAAASARVTGTATDTGPGAQHVQVGIAANGGANVWYPVSALAADGAWSFDWSGAADGDYLLRARARVSKS